MEYARFIFKCNNHLLPYSFNCCHKLENVHKYNTKQNSAMNIFNFVFPLNREEKLYIISVYKCGRMSRRNFATINFQRLKDISNPILFLIIIQTNKSCFFVIPNLIITVRVNFDPFFLLHMTETCLFIYLFIF